MTANPMQALGEVQSELDALSAGCSAINGALAADRASSADLLTESDRLQHELMTSQKRSTLVHSFFKQYQLSAGEVFSFAGAHTTSYRFLFGSKQLLLHGRLHQKFDNRG